MSNFEQVFYQEIKKGLLWSVEEFIVEHDLICFRLYAELSRRFKTRTLTETDMAIIHAIAVSMSWRVGWTR